MDVEHAHHAGQRRALQAAELDEAVDRHVHRVDVAAARRRLDGEGVAHLHRVQLEQRRQLLVEDPVARVEARVVGVEQGRQQPGRVGLLGPQGRLEPPGRLARPRGVELQEDVPGLLGVLLHPALQLLVLRDPAAVDVAGLLDLVEPARGAELEPVLGVELAEQDAALARRDGRSLHHLRAGERPLEGLRIGPDVPDEGEAAVQRERRHPVLQELEGAERVLVEAVPEAPLDGLLQRVEVGLAILVLARALVGDLPGLAELLLEERGHPAQVGLVGLVLRILGGRALLRAPAHVGAQPLERHVEDVAHGHHRLVDAHGHDLLHAGDGQGRGLEPREVVDGLEHRLAHGPAVEGERVAGPGVVELDVAAQASLDAPGHPGVDGVEQRAAQHHHDHAQGHDAADHQRAHPAGHEVPHGHLEQDPRLPEAGRGRSRHLTPPRPAPRRARPPARPRAGRWRWRAPSPSGRGWRR